MKRYILLAVVLVVVVGWMGAAWYFQDSPEPKPPEPAPTNNIVGPKTVKAGEFVVYTTGTKTKFTKWTTVPDGPQTLVTDKGQILVIVFDSPGNYHIVLASSAGKGIELAKIRIKVGGEGPDPPRPPPLPPDPPVPGGWKKWVLDNIPKPYTERKSHLIQLAGRLDALAAQIAAGAVQSPEEARVLLRVSMNEELKKSVKLWVDFSVAFRDRCKELNPKKLKDYRLIYVALAQAFRDFANIQAPTTTRGSYAVAMTASKVDKLPVVVVITSSGCPPCVRLKSEWLPNIKANREYRLVMLDRDRHKDVVETVGTGGIKGRIKVPQVHILRYVDGKWLQFSRVGYTSYSSMDRWVKSVFAWENKL